MEVIVNTDAVEVMALEVATSATDDEGVALAALRKLAREGYLATGAEGQGVCLAIGIVRIFDGLVVLADNGTIEATDAGSGETWRTRETHRFEATPRSIALPGGKVATLNGTPDADVLDFEGMAKRFSAAMRRGN